MLLTQLFDKLLANLKDVSKTLPPRELVSESKKIHSMCLFELVRQVSVHCHERGVLLKRVWEYVLAAVPVVPPQPSAPPPR